MLTFKEFLRESLLKSLMNRIYKKDSPELHWFDMDDTLVHHDPERGARVHVLDSKGSVKKTLSPSEYNEHVKGPGESYGYSEFVDSRVFKDSAHPIRKMINHAQRLLDQGHFVHIITARSDMEHHKILLDALKQMGLDTSHPNFHLHRAGNEGQNPTHENKARMVTKAIRMIKKRHGVDIKNVTGYDDHKPNVVDIHNVPEHPLHEIHPDVQFNGVLVSARNRSNDSKDMNKRKFVRLRTVYSRKKNNGTV